MIDLVVDCALESVGPGFDAGASTGTSISLRGMGAGKDWRLVGVPVGAKGFDGVRLGRMRRAAGDYRMKMCNSAH